MATKTKWIVHYLYRKDNFHEEFDTVEEAFNFVDTMENSDKGGYAQSIWFAGVPEYLRDTNEEVGVAYWVNLSTDDKFVEYRR